MFTPINRHLFFRRQGSRQRREFKQQQFRNGINDVNEFDWTIRIVRYFCFSRIIFPELFCLQLSGKKIIIWKQ